MTNTFVQLLQDKPYLLADGATGTNLFELGLQTGDAPELWNVEHPNRVQRHYQSFIDAGSDIILTNTFGANARRLVLHNASEQTSELNYAGAKLLKDLTDKADRPVAVAGSMGPTGDILEPNGPLSIAEAADCFEQQAQALAGGGCDVLWLETISSKEEVEAAITGASRVGLPVVCTLSIDTNGRTMMGLAPADITQITQTLPDHVTALGTNCGVGASEVVAAILNFTAAEGQDSLPLVAKANCGIPEYIDGKVVYNGSPELMAQYVHMALDAGARIVGGCCGTSPAHVAAMRAAMDDYVPSDKPDLNHIETILGSVSKGAAAQLAGDLSIAGGSASGNTGRQRRRRRG